MNFDHPSIDRHRDRLCQCLFALLATCGLAGCNWSTTMAVESSVDATNGSVPDSAATPAAKSPIEQSPTEQPDENGRLKARLTTVDRTQLVGTWKDSFFGARTLTLNADGTARMVLDLDFAGRLMYGSRLDFDMTWSVEGATVSIDIIKGTPVKAAKSLMQTWGSRYEYLLDCVEDRRIEMRDWDGSMNYTLRRISDDKSPADSR